MSNKVVIVGADGLNSAVRQVLIGDGEPCYAGRMSWRVVIRYSHQKLLANEVMSMTIASNKP
ncbi:hypothetical protein [Nostoc sp. CCY0012]|uniref:hypothetical protein n=1 Tax=Nostoc sp. CCY0012 TaxID=1056123 RepID=UPI0039C73556